MNIEKIFKSPLVVGYKGEIGSFILSGLLHAMPKACNILCFDINETEHEKISRIKKADTIFLCVPIQNTIEWLLKYKKYLKGKIIIEQCSLKSFIYENYRFEDLNIKSMHILFRPSGTYNKEDKRVGLLLSQDYVDEDDPRLSDLAKAIREITDSKIIWFKDYKSHDEEMAKEQALVHRVILILDSAIMGRTYISAKIKELAERIKSGDINLYNFIQENKELGHTLKTFNKCLKDFNLNRYIVKSK